MPELTVRQAREMLAAWVSERQSVTERRDDVVRIAFQAGLSKAEVHRLTGIARTTIDRILVQAPEVGKGDAE
jgi:DNA invertase Pin-like site-specific DNA recombinase